MNQTKVQILPEHLTAIRREEVKVGNLVRLTMAGNYGQVSGFYSITDIGGEGDIEGEFLDERNPQFVDRNARKKPLGHISLLPDQGQLEKVDPSVAQPYLEAYVARRKTEDGMEMAEGLDTIIVRYQG